MANKYIIKDDKKNPVRDCMLVEMYELSHCSTPYGVGFAVGHSFYQHLNPNGFIPSVIIYLFFINKSKKKL
jgi:hypothetical protein